MPRNEVQAFYLCTDLVPPTPVPGFGALTARAEHLGRVSVFRQRLDAGIRLHAPVLTGALKASIVVATVPTSMDPLNLSTLCIVQMIIYTKYVRRFQNWRASLSNAPINLDWLSIARDRAIAEAQSIGLKVQPTYRRR